MSALICLQACSQPNLVVWFTTAGLAFLWDLREIPWLLFIITSALYRNGAFLTPCRRAISTSSRSERLGSQSGSLPLISHFLQSEPVGDATLEICPNSLNFAPLVQKKIKERTQISSSRSPAFRETSLLLLIG